MPELEFESISNENNILYPPPSIGLDPVCIWFDGQHLGHAGVGHQHAGGRHAGLAAVAKAAVHAQGDGALDQGHLGILGRALQHPQQQGRRAVGLLA